MMISADIDCDYGLTAVNISSYDNKQFFSQCCYSPWLTTEKKRDKVVLKTEDPTLDINFQQNWIRKFVKYNSIVHRLIKETRMVQHVCLFSVLLNCR